MFRVCFSARAISARGREMGRQKNGKKKKNHAPLGFWYGHGALCGPLMGAVSDAGQARCIDTNSKPYWVCFLGPAEENDTGSGNGVLTTDGS